MAMKTRTSSTSVRPVYEDFEPSTQFIENHEAHILQMLLPGFTRDQMRISFVNFTRMLNVSGERPIDSENDKRVRFNQSYPIPQNCEEGKLQAHFTQGVLTITMPKKILSKLSPQNEAQQINPFTSKKQDPGPNREAQEDTFQKAREKPMAPRVDEQKPEKAQEKISQKYTPTTQVEELKPEKTWEKTPQKHAPIQIEEPRRKKAQERSPKKYTPRMKGPNPEKAHEHSKLEEHKPDEAHEEEIPFRFRIRRGKEDIIQKLESDGGGLRALIPSEPTKESKSEMGQNETEPTPTIIKSQRKFLDEKPWVGTSETKQRPTLKDITKKPKDEKSGKGKEEIEGERESKRGEEGKLPRKYEKMLQEKEIRTRKNTAEKATKEDIVSTIGKGIRQVSDSTSEVVTKISEGKWKEEEKPMLVNMAVAILVIAALGVYVSYKMT